MQKINSEIFFSFSDISISIGCVKLSLLTREYLSSAVNVLTNNLKTLHITRRNFVRLKCLHSDPKIW